MPVRRHLFLTLGYIFLVVSAIFGVARLAEISWIWIALIAAGVHFLLAVIAVVIAGWLKASKRRTQNYRLS